MIVVNSTSPPRIIDTVFRKYSQSLNLLKTIDYHNKQLYFKFILYEAARKIAEIDEMLFDFPLLEENVQYKYPYSYYVKDQIDLIIKGHSQLVIQTLIDIPNNIKDAIDHLLGESLKLSFENDDKYIFWICEEHVFQTYLNNYGNDFNFKTDDLEKAHNFKIDTFESKESFKISLKMGPVKFDNDNNNIVVALQIN